MAPVRRTPTALPAILLLEDDPDVLRLLVATFSAVGFDPRPTTTAAQALASVRQCGPPALAVVDLILPDLGGLEFCRQVHEFCDLPVIVLTSVTDAGTAVEAIEQHAEDYVRKPFDAEELVARVQRVLRRTGPAPDPAGPAVVLDERVSFEVGAGRATVDGAEFELTPTETKLLHVLSRYDGSAVPNSVLLRRLWPRGEATEDALRVHVHRLRGKLERDPAAPRYLLTERGVGYRLVRHPAAPFVR